MGTITVSGTAQGAIAPSSTLDFYRGAFTGMDFFMSFWQPALKGIGRTQLQMAQVAAQNAQAVVRWTAELSSSRTLSDVVAANIKCCDAIFEQQKDSLEKITSAMSRVVEVPPALEEAVATDQLASVPSRDMLEIPAAGASAVRAVSEVPEGAAELGAVDESQVPSKPRTRGPLPGAATVGKRRRKKGKTGAVRPASVTAWGH